MLPTTRHRSNRTDGLAPVVHPTAVVVLALAVVLAGCGAPPASSAPVASSAGPSAAGTGAAGTGSGGSAGSSDGGGGGISTLPTPSPGNPVGPGYIDDSSATRLGPQLQAELDRLRTSGRLPGLSAAIVFADGSEWQGVSGLADVAARQPLTTDTLFSVGSITKTFVAALVLRLDGEGRLGLDDPISRWLPTFPNASRITVRELLEHRSGVADYFENTGCVDRIVAAPRVPWTTQAVLACVGRPYFAPGAGFHYSNTGYVLLGRIVEAVTGVSLAANLQAAFLGPFVLDRVALQGAGMSDAPLPPLAHGYLAPVRAGGQPIDVTGGDPLLPYTSLATAAGAAGALAATPIDLARWAMALYSGAVLDRGTVEEMVQIIPTSPDPRGGYGLAVESFSFDGLRAWGHRGHLAGYDAQMAYLPGDGLSIAVATNADWASPDSLSGALLAVALPWAEPARRRGQGGLSGE